jgi:hypothetical protein
MHRDKSDPLQSYTNDYILSKNPKPPIPPVRKHNYSKPYSVYTESTYGSKKNLSKDEQINQISQWIADEIDKMPSSVDNIIKEVSDKSGRTFLAEDVEERRNYGTIGNDTKGRSFGSFDTIGRNLKTKNYKQREAATRMVKSFIAKVVKNVNDKIRAARFDDKSLSITGDDVVNQLRRKYSEYPSASWEWMYDMS